MEKKKYNLKDFKTSSKEGRICEALIMIANEIHELKAMIDKNNIHFKSSAN
jgi:hypothetical protein